jgi:hypothetical protein
MMGTAAVEAVAAKAPILGARAPAGEELLWPATTLIAMFSLARCAAA